MRKLVTIVAAAGLVFGTASLAAAANTATQAVNFTIPTVYDINVSTPMVGDLIAVSFGVPVTNNTTRYDIAANAASKITAHLDLDMPTSTVLSVTSAAPSVGGSAVSNAVLSAAATDIVTAIPAGSATATTLTFSFTANAGAAAASGSRTVTLTLTAGS